MRTCLTEEEGGALSPRWIVSSKISRKGRLRCRALLTLQSVSGDGLRLCGKLFIPHPLRSAEKTSPKTPPRTTSSSFFRSKIQNQQSSIGNPESPIGNPPRPGPAKAKRPLHAPLVARPHSQSLGSRPTSMPVLQSTHGTRRRRHPPSKSNFSSASMVCGKASSSFPARHRRHKNSWKRGPQNDARNA